MSEKQPAIDPREVRSKRAKALLEDPILAEILQSLADRAIAEWTNSNSTDAAVRDHAWHRVKAIQSLRDELESAARDSAVRDFNAKVKK